jgi:hypothetical protein
VSPRTQNLLAVGALLLYAACLVALVLAERRWG